MSSFVAIPIKGHLKNWISTLAYLKRYQDVRLVFHITCTEFDYDQFYQKNWYKFYGDVEDELPPDIREQLGKELITRAFLYSDNYGDKTNRRSGTGFLIYMNNALTHFLSKKQTSVENI